MAFYLQALGDANRRVNVSIPQPTLDGASDFSWEIEFEVRANGTDLPISNNGLYNTGSANLIFLKGTTLEVRENGPITTFTHGATISNWNVYRLVGSKVGATRTMTLFVNGVEIQSLSPANGLLWSHNNFFPLGATTRAGDFRYYSFTDNVTPANNKTYTALGTSSGNTLPPDGTLVGFQAEPWVSDGPVVTPITFSGTIPTQSFTNGEIVSEDLSIYFGGTETPFTFANTGTALTGSGLTLSSAGLLSGTYTGTPITGVIVTGTDTATNTASSNAFNIETAAAPQVPQGTITIGTIDVTETTATVSYTYSDTDQTGFEYRLDGVAEVADASSPVDLTGLIANTTYSVEVRAVNSTGPGTWSTTANFTTSAVGVGTFTSEPLKDNAGNLLANEPLDYVSIYDSSTGDLVLKVTGISTNASGIFTVANALLIATTTYKVDWKVASQAQGRMPAKAAT